jgi:hypothetical protein
VNDRQQPTIGVGTVLAGELKRDDPPRSGQRLRKALGWQAAPIGTPVARRGALGRIDLHGPHASQPAVHKHGERVAVNHVIDHDTRAPRTRVTGTVGRLRAGSDGGTTNAGHQQQAGSDDDERKQTAGRGNGDQNIIRPRSDGRL